MSPKSEWGRTVTVCYTLFAVPLTLAWFIITGRALAHAWLKITIDPLCCYLCIHFLRNKDKNKRDAKMRSNSIAPLSDPEFEKARRAAEHFERERMKYRDLRSAASTRSTVSSTRSVGQRLVSEIEPESELASMNHAVSTVFAVLLFVLYFIMWSSFMTIKEDFPITDSMYFNFLLLTTIGPTCSDFDNSLFETWISKQLCYFYFLFVGYSILSMIFHLIYTFYFPTDKKH